MAPAALDRCTDKVGVDQAALMNNDQSSPLEFIVPAPSALVARAAHSVASADAADERVSRTMHGALARRAVCVERQLNRISWGFFAISSAICKIVSELPCNRRPKEGPSPSIHFQVRQIRLSVPCAILCPKTAAMARELDKTHGPHASQLRDDGISTPCPPAAVTFVN